MMAEYDADDDLSKSIEFCYAEIRKRTAAGGPGWPASLQDQSVRSIGVADKRDPTMIPTRKVVRLASWQRVFARVRPGDEGHDYGAFFTVSNGHWLYVRPSHGASSGMLGWLAYMDGALIGGFSVIDEARDAALDAAAAAKAVAVG